jgi:hypothetical protein
MTILRPVISNTLGLRRKAECGLEDASFTDILLEGFTDLLARRKAVADFLR